MSLPPFIRRMWAFACILLVSQPLYPHSAENGADEPDTLKNTHELNELVVSGIGTRGRHRAGHISMSGSEIRQTPVLLGEPDVIKALQSTSGVVSGTEGFAGMYVRGGETDQNLYLLDGLPLLNVYHFGGLFSTFCPNSIESVDFFKGAFPSRFSERVSGIVDIGMKKPDFNKTTGTFYVGLISGQIYMSTPLRKGYSALSVALRRTWFDLLSIPALAILNRSNESDGKKTIFHYNFTDMSLWLDASDKKSNHLSALLFWGKDDFKLGEQLFDTKNEKHLYHSDLNKMSWGNWGVTVNYRHAFPFGELKIQPYISRSFSLDYQENSNTDRDKGMVSAFSKTTPSVMQAGMKETFRMKLNKSLEAEAGLHQAWYDYGAGNPTSRFGDMPASPAAGAFPDHSYNILLSGFADLSWDVGGLIQGTAGIRATRYVSKDRSHWNAEPRVSMKICLPYSSNFALGYSRIVQYAQQVSSNYIYLPSDAWLPTATYVKPLTCDIYSAGFSKNFFQGFSINAEAWWKNMENLAEYCPAACVSALLPPWLGNVTFGKGWAYGLDVETSGHYRRVNWKIAYGMMWNWRKFNKINGGRRYPAKFDNRHKLDIGIGWKISDRLELNGQWEYMTGNRMTAALYNIAPPDLAFPDAPFVNPLDPGGKRQDGIDYFENRNNVRMPAFHRLNLNLSLKGNLNKKLSYQWDFGLYNAYCRMNPFSLVKSYVNDAWSDNGDYRKFKSLSLLPIIPSISYTLNF